MPGLLGPLLADDGVALVKGFYERTAGRGRRGRCLARGGPGDRAGGASADRAGVARAELAGAAPGREWSVRRDLFERLTVPTGYAVELAALIDTARLLGPDAIAQVDLGRRAHRHQALRDLGAMAAQILAASRRRSARLGARTTSPSTSRTRSASDIETTRSEITLLERPPAIGVPDPVAGFEA